MYQLYELTDDETRDCGRRRTESEMNMSDEVVKIYSDVCVVCNALLMTNAKRIVALSFEPVSSLSGCTTCGTRSPLAPPKPESIS